MELRLITLALCLLGVSAVPISKEIVTQCARQCSNDPQNFRYKTGSTYIYNYESLTKLHLTDDTGPEVKVTAKADISVLSDCEFSLRLRDVDVRGPVDRFEIKSGLEAHSMVFAYDDGRIDSVCPSPTDERWAVNVKKGILSSLQVSLKSLSGSTVVREKDVLGECETTYEVQSQTYRGTVIRKTKDMKTCGNRNQAVAGIFPRGYFSPDTAIQSLPIMNNDFSCDITVKNDMVFSSLCKDKNTFVPLTWSKAGSHVETILNIRFDKTIGGLSAQRLPIISRQHLLYLRAPENKESDELQVMGILRDICSKVSDEIRPEVPAKFAELVYALRPLSYSTVARIHQSVKRGELCSSTKLNDLWNDALIMDSSEGSLKLVSEMITRKEISTAKANYLLTMLAFANRPTLGAARALVPLLERSDAPRQALLGASALIHNLCNDQEIDCSSATEIKEVVNAIAKHLGNRCDRKDKPEQVIVALKALKNIGYLGEATSQVLACASAGGTKRNAVRVSAIAALKEISCENQVRTKAMDIFSNTDEDNEVRIAAYRIAIECPERDTIQQIITILKKENSKQVGAYVTSHLENMQTSSDPHKRHVRELLAEETINSNRFPKDIRKYSRHAEMSYLLEKINMGGIAEADIIYDRSFAPRSLRLNLTGHAFGKSLNLVELELRQVGLEEQVEKLMGPHGILNKKDMPEIVAEIMDLFQERSNEIRTSRFRRALNLPFKQGKLDLLSERASVDSSHAEASLAINVDGKTVTYLDLNDANEDDMKEVLTSLKKHFSKIGEALRDDRAFSFMFLDSTHEIPSVNGFPIKLDMNGTVILGHKGKNKAFWPSMAAELSCKMGFDAKSSKPGLKWVQTVHAAPAIQTEIETKDSRPVKVTFSMPKDQMELFSYHSDILIVDEKNQERPLKGSNNRKIEGCTKSFNSVLGVEFCSKIVTPKPFFNPTTPILPLNGPWAMEITLQKTDRGMKGWEYALEIPQRGAQEMRVYRASFNTPGSRIDRELSAELQLSTPQDGSKGARLRVKTPIKQIEATASHKWDSLEYTTKAEVTVDHKDKYAFELGLDKDVKSKKTEYKPRLRIQMPNAKPIALGGSVILDQGRKSQLAFDLHGDKASAQSQYFKGSFVKEGSLSLTKDFRLSSDLQGDLGMVTFRVFGMAEKQAKSLSTDMKVEYQRPNSRKHNVKLVGKLQNLSTGSLSKLNSFLEVQMSQLPEANCHLSWNLLHKPREHLENEVTILWRDQMRDPKRKIHLLQVSKFTGVTVEKTTCENVLTVEIAPLDINYEIKASGNLEKGETPKFRMEANLNNKNARDQEVRGSFEYQHISRKPLKLSMEALLKVPSREIRYSDKLEEVAPNEYRGKTMFQWEQDKRATLDYTYRVKTDSKKTHHEFDAELKTPSMRFGTHHQALLRMTNDEVEIKSKLTHERANMWNYDSLISRTGPSHISLDTAHLTSRLETNPFEATRASSFELTGKTFPINHQSNLQVSPKQVTVSSKTIYKSRPILTINAHHGEGQTSRFNVETIPFDARLDVNAGTVPRTASVDIRTKRTPGQHKTTIAVDNGKIEIKSKTQLRGTQIASIDCALNSRAKSHFNLDVPQMIVAGEAQFGRTKNAKITIKGKQMSLEHTSELNVDPSTIRCVSNTHRNNDQLYSFESTLNRNSGSMAKITTRHIRGNLEVNHVSPNKAIKVEFADLIHPLEHKTEISSNGQTLNFLSNTERSGRQVALIDARLDKNRSHLKVDCDAAEGSLELVSGKTGKLEVRCKKTPIYHKTVVNVDRAFVTLNSRTDRSSRPLATIDTKISRTVPSHVRIEGQGLEGSLEVDPVSRIRTLKLNVKGQNGQYVHNSLVSVEPRESVALVSTTDRAGRQLAHIDSMISRSQKSHLKVNTQPWKCLVEANPHAAVKTAKIEIVGHQNGLIHASEVTVQPRNFNLQSKTESHNRQILAVDCNLAAAGKSHLRINSAPANILSEINPSAKSGLITIKSQALDAVLNSDCGQKVKIVKLDINAKRQGLAHKSQVSWEPKQSLAVVSSTSRSGQTLWDLDSALHRNAQSHFRLNGQQWNAHVEALPIGSQKTLKIKLNCPKYQHTAEALYEPHQSLKITSTTKKSGRQVMDIDSHISAIDKSHVRVSGQQWNANLECKPFAQVKTLKAQINGQTIAHSINAEYEPRQNLMLDGSFKSQGQQVLAINSRLSRSDKSHLQLKTNQWNGNLEVNPVAQTKTIHVTLDGQQIAHSSNAQWIPRQSLTLESTTKKSGRQVLEINSRLTRDVSHLRVNTDPWNCHIEAQPNARVKVAKIEVIGNRNQLKHNTQVSWEPKSSLGLVSNTLRGSNQLFKIDSLLSRKDRSHVKVNTQPWDCSVEANGIASIKTAKVLINGKDTRFVHASDLSYTPRRSLAFNSKTENNGKQLVLLNSNLNRAGKSFLSINTQPITGHFEAEPEQRRGQIKITSQRINAQVGVDGSQRVKTAKVEVTSTGRIPVTHHSVAEWEPNQSLNLVSVTKKSGQQWLDINSHLSRSGKSLVKINTQPWDGSLELTPDSRTKSLKWDIVGKKDNLKHTTTLSMEPRSVSLFSRTDKQSRPIVLIDSRLSADDKSHFKADCNRFDIMAEVHPQAAVKTAKLAYKCKQSHLIHASEASYEPKKTITFISRTERSGQPIAVINTNLNRAKESSVSLESRSHTALIRVQPWDTVKTAQIEIKSKNRPYSHISKATLEPTKITFDSNTKSSGQSVAQVDAVFSRNSKSHVIVASKVLDTKFHIQPFGSSKNMKLEITGNQIPIRHLTDASCDGNLIALKTNTHWDSRRLMDLDTSYRRNTGVAKVNCDTPAFHGKVDFDPASSSLNMDYLARHSNNRRILCAVSAIQGQKNGFKAEVKWDADKNPEQSIEISANTVQNKDWNNPKTIVDLRGAYGKINVVSIHSEMARDLIKGPHDITVELKAANNKPQTVTFHHELANGQIKCTAKYIKNGELKIRFENIGKFEQTSTGHLFNAGMSITSAYKSIDGVQVSLNHRYTERRDGADMTAEIKGQLEADQPYQAKATIYKKSTYSGGNLNARLSASTPLYDFKSQDLAINTEWNSRSGAKMNGEMKISNGKGIKFNGEVGSRANSASASFEVDSDFEVVPDVKVNMNAENDRQKKSFSLTTDVDSDRKLALTGNFNSNGYYNYEGQMSATSAWTPRYAASIKGIKDSNRIDYELVAKEDAQQIFAAKASGKKARNGWTGNAAISAMNTELARLDLEHDLSASGEELYTANVRGPIQPLKVTYKMFKNAKELRPTLSICPSNSAGNCISLEGLYKNDDSRYYGKTERVATLVYRNQRDSSEVRMDWILNNKDAYVNKLTFSANGRQVGYDVQTSTQDRISSVVAKLLLPQRTMEARLSHEDKTAEGFRMTADLLHDSLREPNQKLSADWTFKSTNVRGIYVINSQIKASAPEMRRPVTATFFLEQKAFGAQNPLNAKLTLDYQTDPQKKLILTAAVDSETSTNNHTLTLTASRPDRRIDATLKSHWALEDSVHSNGIQWQWLNRRGERKQGGYIVKIDGEKNIVSLNSYSPSHHLVADGTYRLADNRLSVDMKVNANGNERKAHLQLDAQDKPCAELTILKHPAEPVAKYQACISAENDRMLKISAESFDGSEKSTDASIVFDKRSGRAFRAHLQWNPEVLTGAFIKLAQVLEEQKSRDLGLKEIPLELQHKLDLIRSNIYLDIYKPVYTAYANEFQEINSELAQTMRPLNQYLPETRTLRRAYRQAADTAYEYTVAAIDGIIPDNLSLKADQVTRSITRSLKRACARDSACYKLAQSYERQGIQGIIQEVANICEQSHRLVTSVAGNLQKNVLNRLPSNWFQQVTNFYYNLGHAVANLMRPLFDNEFVRKVGQMGSDSVDMVVQGIEQLVQKVILRVDDVAVKMMRNADIRATVIALREVIEEIKRELKKVKVGEALDLSDEMIAFLMDPKTWASHTRVMVWNPEQGEILVEAKLPFDGRRLKAIWQPTSSSAKYSTLSDRLNALKSNLWTEWAPPFRAQAMLVGGQHFVTFDRKFYDFAGPECSYLLARDFKDGNFSVIAKYQGVDDQGRVRKSLVVSVNNKHIEINNELQQVKMDGAIMELPLFVGSASVLRRGQSIVVDDKHGIIVECQLQHDICTVAVSGWYFGKTSGLMGTYDYEPSNDMRLPRGGLATNAAALAAAWEVEDSCRTQNMARDEEISKGTQGYDICYRHFVSEQSPLRAGFSISDPQDFFRMCLRHMAATHRFQAPEKAICTVSAAYVNLLKHNKLTVNMPAGCLSCPTNNMEYGARRTMTRPYAAPKQADVVFVVEEHECNRPLVKEIDSVARLLERELSASGFKNNRYGVVAFSGPQENGEPHIHTARGKMLFDVHDVVLATQRMEYRKRANDHRQVDTFEAISFAADYPFRAGASKNLILLTCTPCQEEVMRLDYSDVQRLLLSEGITLHIMNDKAIEMKSAQKKGQNIFAVDAKTVFRGKDFSQKRLTGQVDLRSQVIVPKDVCIALAQESRGSFFSTQPLFTSESKQWRSLLARRVTETADPQVCQVCDCIMDRDHHSKTVCRPCKPFLPAYFMKAY